MGNEVIGDSLTKAIAHRTRVESAWAGAIAATNDPVQKACLADSLAHELDRANQMIRSAGGTA